MRFSVALAFLSAAAAPALGVSIFDKKAIATDDDHKIPGESPLELCPGEHSDDLITIKSVDLAPNPPAAGKELVIKATGSVKKTIEKGAYIDLVVKYGLIRLIKTRADLCDEIGEVDMECPVEPGERVISKTVELPKEIPPGKYTVQADVYTADDVKVTCLTATVSFNLPSFMENEL